MTLRPIGEILANWLQNTHQFKEGSMPETTDLTTEYIERRTKFKKRAEYNLNRKVLDGFKQLTRCANRSRYAYDDDQVAKLLLEIRQGLADVERAFADAGGAGQKWVEL